MCLEILSRLPLNETLRPFVLEILALVMELLEIENEDNGIVCLRIIIDLHKNYKGILEDHVQPFLDVIIRIFKGYQTAVDTMLESKSKV